MTGIFGAKMNKLDDAIQQIERIMGELPDSDKVVVAETALMNLPDGCFANLMKTIDTDIVILLVDGIAHRGN